MSSVRLRKDQIERLRASGQGAEMIRWAVSRWKRGDFVTGNSVKKKYCNNLLQVYSLWRKPSGISDSLLREILDLHFAIPDLIRQKKLDAEIAFQDRIIEEQFKLIPKGPIILENLGGEDEQ